MTNGKKPKSTVSASIDDALKNMVFESGQKTIPEEESTFEGILRSERDKIENQISNPINTEKESVVAKEGEADSEKREKKIPKCPESVFKPIWRKVHLLLNEADFNEEIAEQFINDKYEHQLPKLDMSPEEKIQVAKSLFLLEEVLKAIPGSHYIVQKLKQSLIEGKELEAGHKEEGVMMMADISGFTSMMEKGAGRGKIGVSEVHEKINNVFKHLGKVVVKHKGFVMKYGGDAMTIYFHGREAEKRAQSCGVLMQKEMARLHNPDDPESLKLSIGMASDEFHLGIIGDKKRRELIIGGSGIDNMEESERMAEPGEVIMSYPDSVKKIIEKAPDIESDRDSDWGLHLEKLFVDKTYKKRFEGKDVELPNQFLEKNSIGNATDVCNAINQLSSTLLSFAPQGTSDQLFRPEAEPEWGAGNTAVFIKFDDVDYTDSEAVNDDYNYVFRKINRLVTEYKGRIDKFGPSLLIRFSPLGKAGGSARRAYECANEILSVCTEYKDNKMPLKIGIATGNMMQGQFGSREEGLQYEYTVLGDPVNMAARLMARAETGEILVTPEVLETVESRLGLIDERKGTFKGKTGELPYFSVGGWSRLYGLDIADYLDTAGEIYGREEGLEEAGRAIQKVLQGDSRSILIETEAGMGKTKLLKHILRLSGAADMNLYGAGAEVHTSKQAFHLWKNVVCDILHLDPAKKNEEQKEEANKLLSTLDLSKEDLEPLFAVMGFSDKVFADSIKQASIGKLLKEVSKVSPLTIALEDLHWADVESLNTLDYLMRSLKDSPILFVATSRPEGVATQDYDERFELDGLKPKDIEEIAKDILTQSNTLLEPISKEKNKHFSGILADYIFNISGGNPLFAEEAVFALIRKGYLKYGHFAPLIALPEHDLELTDDLQSLIEGRIKHLTYQGVFDNQIHDILHLITVVGSNPPPGLLERLRAQHNINDQVYEDGLRELIKNHFVEIQEGDLHFRHDLIRVAIAKMLSPKKLRKLHRQAITFFEKVGWDDAPENIFHHAHEVVKNYGVAAGHSYKEVAKINSEALTFMEKMYVNGLRAIKKLKGQAASQRAIIFYCEEILKLADALGLTIQEKRRLLTELAKQKTSIGGQNEIEEALQHWENCLELGNEIVPDNNELFERLTFLGNKMETHLVLSIRDPKRAKKIYDRQIDTLKLLESRGCSNDLKYKKHYLLAQRTLIYVKLYRAYEMKPKNKEQAYKNLNKTLAIVNENLNNVAEHGIELRTWFLFLMARTFQEMDNHKEAYRNTIKALKLYLSDSDSFKSSTLIKDMHLFKCEEFLEWSHQINNAKMVKKGFELSETMFEFFQKRGEINPQTALLEYLSNFSMKIANEVDKDDEEYITKWENCIKWALKSYSLTKDHNIPNRLGYALANLTYSYFKLGQIEAAKRYYQEFDELIKISVAEKTHQNEFISIKRDYLDPLFAQ